MTTDATSTAAPAFKDAFVTAVATLFTPGEVLVSFGHPGMAQPDNIVGVMDVRSEIDFATYTPSRTRDEVLELDVIISCHKGGKNVAEKSVSDRAYGYLRQIERYVRLTDTSVGDTVRQCFLIRHTSEGRTDPNELSAGRTIEILATFGAVARIRN